ncbi:hypothetical protein JXQ70_02915 [bacterium]|nr:hypothetical protein [bacterium]
MKRIVMPVWGSRLSPVFDTAQQFIVVDREGDQIVERSFRNLTDDIAASPWVLLQEVLSWQPHQIVCGAISGPLFHQFESYRIEVYAWLTGEVDQVLRAVLTDERALVAFLMPGCSWTDRPGQFCRQKRMRGHGRGRGFRGQRHGQR